jgi:8-oxo-dGTP pyrophosphatase MutT (NUDIX family)
MGDSGVTRTEAGVLIPVYRDNQGDLRLILIRRSERGIHGGQLAFPGGKHDRGDTTMLATALREAQEEIGLLPEDVTVLESLPCVDTMTSDFRLYPFLASIVPPIAWLPEVEEVSEVIDTRLADLAHADRHGEQMMNFPHWPKPYRVPFYLIGEHQLWGATYRILRPLLPRILAGEWDI